MPICCWKITSDTQPQLHLLATHQANLGVCHRSLMSVKAFNGGLENRMAGYGSYKAKIRDPGNQKKTQTHQKVVREPK
ncbi:hypothetical protein XELAEV_18026776mg [Xenopus laevis]|uniref:Uncharacterized protein n=1 Tax=Xenopus laevis TaxID=8355 RepID=A0A974CWL9_XENLA|nr:hypothetical protein XELAEV_18026776mg [Xenopus laevis]